MRKSRFTESQIVAILNEGESGIAVAEVCRKHGISQPTYYQWKSKYAGVSVSELKRMRELEIENDKLKRLFAEQALEIAALKDVLGKKALTSSERKEMARRAVAKFGLKVSKACELFGLSRTTYYNQSESNRIQRDAAFD